MFLIKEARTIEQLDKMKGDFLIECKKQENKILAKELLNSINDFVNQKNIFESLATNIMNKRGGKNLINRYINEMKENKSLKTMYTLHEGLNNNSTSESKKVYITEALNITKQINEKELLSGSKKLNSFIKEAFEILGDEFVLENVSIDEKSKTISESLKYLTTTKKNIVNLNEYMNHIDNVSDIVAESKNSDINVDLSLDEVVNKFKATTVKESVEDIFNTDNKEEAFRKNKQICLEMITNQKKKTEDSDIISELNKMEEKLGNKHYTFETYTKDMLYMTELQEILK